MMFIKINITNIIKFHIPDTSVSDGHYRKAHAEECIFRKKKWKLQKEQILKGKPFKFLEGWRLVGNETDALDLALVVESNDTNERVWVCLLGLLKLLQHLWWVCASEHGKLPHCPVASIVVSWRLVVLTVHESMLYIHKSYKNKKF